MEDEEKGKLEALAAAIAQGVKNGNKINLPKSDVMNENTLSVLKGMLGSGVKVRTREDTYKDKPLTYYVFEANED